MCHITILYIYTISLNKFLNIFRKSLDKTFKQKFNLYCNYIVYEQKILSVTREHYKQPTTITKIVSHKELEQKYKI